MYYLIFQSNLFFANQPEDQCDHWFLGADCAGWLYARLLPHSQIKDYCCPVMEDWGWFLSVEVDTVRVEMCLYHWVECDMGEFWILIVSPKNKVFKKHSMACMHHAVGVVREALVAIVSQAPAFNRYAWVEESPFEIALSEITVDWNEAGSHEGAE